MKEYLLIQSPLPNSKDGDCVAGKRLKDKEIVPALYTDKEVGLAELKNGENLVCLKSSLQGEKKKEAPY